MYSVGRSRMKEFLKKNWQISLVGLTTLVLAVIALTTAWRLYQVGKEPIAPTAPTSLPQAVEPEEPEVGVCTLEFTIEAISCYDTCTVDTDCPQNFGDDEVDLVCDEDENICVNEDCSDENDCECPEETPTPIPTPTPKPTPSPSPSPSIAGSPVPSPSLESSPSPQQVELPEAGIISPTILATLGGIILVLIGLLL